MFKCAKSSRGDEVEPYSPRGPMIATQSWVAHPHPASAGKLPYAGLRIKSALIILNAPFEEITPVIIVPDNQYPLLPGEDRQAGCH